MTKMAIVLYKYQIVIALLCGIFGLFFAFLGYKYYKFGLFGMGFLLCFFISVSLIDMLVVSIFDNEQSTSTIFLIKAKRNWVIGNILISMFLSLISGFIFQKAFKFYSFILSRSSILTESWQQYYSNSFALGSSQHKIPQHFVYFCFIFHNFGDLLLHQQQVGTVFFIIASIFIIFTTSIMGSCLFWIFFCFISMRLGTVFNSTNKLQQFDFANVDTVYYISISVSVLLFWIGFIFQFCRFKKLKKKMEFTIMTRRQQSLIEQYDLEIPGKKKNNFKLKKGMNMSGFENQKNGKSQEKIENFLDKTSDIML